MNSELIDQAWSVFEQYGDGDMTRDEVITLLTMNDFSLEVATYIADDLGFQ